MKSKENWNPLTFDEAYVIEKKGTERPFTGEYYSSKDTGTYHCKRCDLPLYRSDSKFDSGCGWPSFDEFIDKNVRFVLDAHLGHVFFGEQFTAKNTRHCVNSIAVKLSK